MNKSTHILVVEDEPLSRDMLVRRLQSRSFSAFGVENAEAALDFIDNNPVDLILMDNDLPVMSGIDTVRHLRRNWSHDSLPIIMVSAMVDSDDVVEGLQAGANDYVMKPVNFSVLMARIQTALAIKNNVAMLLEAERQRVILQSLSTSASQIAEPFEKMIDELEAAMNNDHEPREDTNKRLNRLLMLCEKAVEKIEMMNKLTILDQPFISRIDELDRK